ncbi:ATP-dependent RNA helicase HrpA [Patulibacter sp. NPDC049589]|uniref:ATP-dependent RNA helicase HrpA n=1 Tax=Patulibacter sp. NPDC049589 TaxID=3154731 RepID=UPI0034371D31
MPVPPDPTPAGASTDPDAPEETLLPDDRHASGAPEETPVPEDRPALDAAGGPPRSPSVGDLRARLRDLRLRDEHRLIRKVDRLRHQKDRDVRAKDLAKVLGEIERAEAAVAARRDTVPEITYPEDLPVSQRRDDLLAAIRDHQVVVVAGETGSGKTTQIPKMCLELGRGIRGQIAHTQPRRIAARTVAERIADETNTQMGEAIGYSVRFNDHSGENTLVRLMTDGLLLAEIQRDRLLRRYDTIIIDEAHERSLNIDFLLGVIKQLLPQRPDLKVIITSATIDPERFSKHFGDAPIVEVSGRTFPVEVRYRPVDDPESGDADRDQVDAIGDAVEELGHEAPGDVLVFLSGEREIRDAAEALRGRFGGKGAGPHAAVEVLPLYARLSSEEQQRVFRRSPGGRRRVVLATNVAETSLTVPGIKYVVDPGQARISRYSSRLKVQRLPIEAVSQASANQRKGRCGRTSDGICIRLFSEEDFDARPEFTDPEILRTNLASVILQMAALGLGEIQDFPFLEPPDRPQIRDGVQLLEELGALKQDEEDPKKRLTPTGRTLAALPIDPRLGRMVLEADRLGCTEQVVVIAAALSIQDPRERPQDKQEAAQQSHARFRHPESDFLGFLNLWEYLQEQQRELSGSAFRRRCKQEFLHYLRIREWQDLVAQLRQAAKGTGIKVPRGAGSRPGLTPQLGSDGPLEADVEERLRSEAAGSGANGADRPANAAGSRNARRRGRGRGRDAQAAVQPSETASTTAEGGSALPDDAQLRPIDRAGGTGVARLRAAEREADRIRAASERDIHQALLSGLLSHVGLKDVTQKTDQKGRVQRKGRPQRPEFLGARGARFQIFPGSTLAKKPPVWTMVAELVETSRLWGRTAAKIEPEWIEPLAEHLLRRTYAEPRWSKKRASVVADERATLYGLPVVAGRPVQYAQIDPILSRELFIRQALVEGEWHGGKAGGQQVLEQNAALIEEVRAMEERARRRDLLVDDEVLYAFYDERIPEHVVSGAHFDRWWRDQKRVDPELLHFTRDLLIDERSQLSVGVGEDLKQRPEAWKQGDHVLRLTYAFEPGTDHDGVTVHVPLDLLPQVKVVGFEWLVPGLRRELIEALVRGLPKDVRRELVPIPDTVTTVLERIVPRSAPLPVALARELNELPGVQVTPNLLRLDALPAHLRMTFSIEDEGGAVLSTGHDLAALRAALRPVLRKRLEDATPDLERKGLTTWSIGTLQREIGLPGGGEHGVRVFPALVDEGTSVGVRAFDAADAQAAAMTLGTRRLLLLTVPSPARKVVSSLPTAAQLTLATAPHGSVDRVLEDTIAATIDVLVDVAGGPAWDEAGFAALRASVAERLQPSAKKVLQQVVRVLDAEREVRSRLEHFASTVPHPAFEAAQRDVTAQIGRLVHPGFVTDAGARRLPDLVRYLDSAAARLDRLPDARATDTDRMQAIHELEQAYARRVQAWPPGRPLPRALAEVRWMLEELRVVQFAGGVGTKAIRDPSRPDQPAKPVSSKRIRKALDDAPVPA